MIVGCPKEIKNNEYRVGLTPAMVADLTRDGHQVLIQEGAGVGSGFSDDEYSVYGAEIKANAANIFESSEMIVKVKEPQNEECSKLTKGQILFTYLHLAADEDQTQGLIKSKATAFAYETVTDNLGNLPLLAPMSEVAGRLAPQMGAWALQKANGGAGKLLSGAPGVNPTNVLIIGAGVVGTQAALIASGMGAKVTLMDKSLARLKYLDEIFFSRFSTVYASNQNIEDALPLSDIVIGAVLVPGAEAPKLISKKQLSILPKGSVLVDVAIDQGGCFETSRATTHEEPLFEVDGIVHYCVANIPGTVPNTSTLALTNATAPFVKKIAKEGWKKACQSDRNLLNGLNVHNGMVTNEPVSNAFKLGFHNPETLI